MMKMVVRHHTTTSKNTENMKIGAGGKGMMNVMIGCNMTRRGMCYEVQSVFLKQITKVQKVCF